jgi:hypothetical protein
LREPRDMRVVGIKPVPRRKSLSEALIRKLI